MSEELDDLLGDMPSIPIKHGPKEESIDDLLGDIPLSVPKTRSLSVPHISGPMIAFRTRLRGDLIIGPGTKYMVVRDGDGKLHYKEYSACVFLPDTWTETDGLPDLP